METTIRINTDLEKAAFSRQTIYRLQGFGKWCRWITAALARRNCSQVHRPNRKVIQMRNLSIPDLHMSDKMVYFRPSKTDRLKQTV